MLYLSIVRPLALYGPETWTLLPSFEEVVDVQEMQWLRQYANISLLKHHLTNGEVRRRAHCPVPISEACRQARLRYYGHLCPLPRSRIPLIALLKDAPGPRKQGHSHASWLELLKANADTRGLTLSDLQRLAPEREAYRQLVIYGVRKDGHPTQRRLEKPDL